MTNCWNLGIEEFRDLGIEKCWDAEILGLGMNGWGKKGE